MPSRRSARPTSQSARTTCDPLFKRILFERIAGNDIDGVRDLLADPHRPTGRSDVLRAVTQSGVTPLMAAARDGHADLCRFLLEAGAERDHTTVLGWSPLSMAVFNGHSAAVAVLLEAGAAPLSSHPNGQDVLLMAGARGHTACARLLVAALIHHIGPEQAAERAAEAFVLAAVQSHPETCAALLEDMAALPGPPLDLLLARTEQDPRLAGCPHMADTLRAWRERGVLHDSIDPSHSGGRPEPRKM